MLKYLKLKYCAVCSAHMMMCCVLQRCSWYAVMVRGCIAITGVMAGLTALTIMLMNLRVSDESVSACSFDCLP
jgi:hypothetical protein